MNEEKPNYYAIIPADIRYSKKIPDKAKLLYGEISALCNKDGICWASNNYFAELYDMSKSRISHLLSLLQNENYIKIQIEYDEEEKVIKRRLIYLITSSAAQLLDNEGIAKNSHTYSQKQLEGIAKNSKENNININNIYTSFQNENDIRQTLSAT